MQPREDDPSPSRTFSSRGVRIKRPQQASPAGASGSPHEQEASWSDGSSLVGRCCSYCAVLPRAKEVVWMRRQNRNGLGVGAPRRSTSWEVYSQMGGGWGNLGSKNQSRSANPDFRCYPERSAHPLGSPSLGRVACQIKPADCLRWICLDRNLRGQHQCPHRPHD